MMDPLVKSLKRYVEYYFWENMFRKLIFFTDTQHYYMKNGIHDIPMSELIIMDMTTTDKNDYLCLEYYISPTRESDEVN